MLHACMLRHFSRVQLFATPGTIAHQAPLSMGFFRQEDWSGFPCPPPRESSRPRDWTHVPYVSCTGRRVLYHQRHLGSPGKEFLAPDHGRGRVTASPSRCRWWQRCECGAQAWPAVFCDLGCSPPRSEAKMQWKMTARWGRRAAGSPWWCPACGAIWQWHVPGWPSLSAESGGVPSCQSSLLFNPFPKPRFSMFPSILWVTRYPFKALFFLLKFARGDLFLLSPRNSDCPTWQLWLFSII